MNAYKEDPQLALTTLEKIAEEIPSGVSAQDVSRLLPTIRRNRDEITDMIRENIVEVLKSEIRLFWSSYAVDEKLKMVKDLRRSDVDIRPPTSREEVLNAAKAKQLKVYKEAVSKKLEAIQKENQDLEKDLMAKSELIKQQMEAVKTCELTF